MEFNTESNLVASSSDGVLDVRACGLGSAYYLVAQCFLWRYALHRGSYVANCEPPVLISGILHANPACQLIY